MVNCIARCAAIAALVVSAGAVISGQAAAQGPALNVDVNQAANQASSVVRIDEELDYRIAQRMKSLQGWRAFLAAHESGRCADDAKAEIDKVLAAENAQVKAAAEATHTAPLVEASEGGPHPSAKFDSAAAVAPVEPVAVVERMAEDPKAEIDKVLAAENAQAKAAAEATHAAPLVEASEGGPYPSAKSDSAAAAAPVEPAAVVERKDEELDYRIAQRMKSLQGWRTFLAAHESGRYADDVKAEIDKLLAAENAQAKAATEATHAAPLVEASEGGPYPAAKSDSEHADQRSEGTRVASLGLEDVCQRGAKRLLEVGRSPVDDETDGSISEPHCHQLQPEVLRLMWPGGPATTAPTVVEASKPASDEIAIADEGQGNPSQTAQLAEAETLSHEETVQDSLRGPVLEPASASQSPPAKAAPAGFPKAHTAAFSHNRRPSRHASRCSGAACYWGHPELPPILMALLGEKPRHHSSFGRNWIADRATAVRGR